MLKPARRNGTRQHVPKFYFANYDTAVARLCTSVPENQAPVPGVEQTIVVCRLRTARTRQATKNDGLPHS